MVLFFKLKRKCSSGFRAIVLPKGFLPLPRQSPPALFGFGTLFGSFSPFGKASELALHSLAESVAGLRPLTRSLCSSSLVFALRLRGTHLRCGPQGAVNTETFPPRCLRAPRRGCNYPNAARSLRFSQQTDRTGLNNRSVIRRFRERSFRGARNCRQSLSQTSA